MAGRNRHLPCPCEKGSSSPGVRGEAPQDSSGEGRPDRPSLRGGRIGAHRSAGRLDASGLRRPLPCLAGGPGRDAMAASRFRQSGPFSSEGSATGSVCLPRAWRETPTTNLPGSLLAGGPGGWIVPREVFQHPDNRATASVAGFLARGGIQPPLRRRLPPRGLWLPWGGSSAAAVHQPVRGRGGRQPDRTT